MSASVLTGVYVFVWDCLICVWLLVGLEWLLLIFIYHRASQSRAWLLYSLGCRFWCQWLVKVSSSYWTCIDAIRCVPDWLIVKVQVSPSLWIHSNWFLALIFNQALQLFPITEPGGALGVDGDYVLVLSCNWHTTSAEMSWLQAFVGLDVSSEWALIDPACGKLGSPTEVPVCLDPCLLEWKELTAGVDQ